MFNLIPWRKEKEGTRALERKGHPLSVFRDEIDDLFERFFGRYAGLSVPDFWAGRGWGLDVEDAEQEVVVRAEAPGFEPDDFDVQVHGNVLTVRAEREGGEKKNGHRYTHRQLSRSVSLPPGVDPEKVEARYRNGVLELRLGKSPQAQGKRIKVQGS